MAGAVPIAGGSLEHDPIGLDASRRLTAEHQHAAEIEPGRTVLRMDGEKLGGGPTQPVRFVTELIAEGQRTLADRGSLGQGQVPTERTQGRQVFNLSAPAGDDRVKRGGSKV